MTNFNDIASNQKYFKRNYVEVLEMLTPDLYLDDDVATFGKQISPLDRLINSHIDIAKNFNTIFNISGTTEGSALRSFSGIASYFVKQNNILKLDAFDFERLILKPLNKRLKDFTTSGEFNAYITSTLLPNIQLNKPNYLFGLLTQDEAHDYLIENMSWLYFLNLSGPAGLAYQPSSYVRDILVNKTFYGDTIYLNDGIKGLQNHIWRNTSVCSLFQNFIPTGFTSGSDKYTSGTLPLEKLETLIDVIYSPLQTDSKDYRVQNAFDDYLSTSSYLETLESSGVFHRLLKAISFGMFDINDQVSNLLLLKSIDDCPEQYLPYLAELIGWELIGPNPERWRTQLKSAVEVYKAKGTKTALDVVTKTLFGDSYQQNSFMSSKIEELWESYIPNLIYYALNTETSAFDNFDIWTRSVADALGITEYSETNMDTNIRFVVDDILRRAVSLFPDNFYIGDSPFRINDEDFVFKYRDRITNIPPWEYEKYYKYCTVTRGLLDYIYDRLVCLGVRRAFADQLYTYIDENVLLSTRESSRNGFLFFTKQYQTPPNYNEILGTLNQSKYKFLPMWNGKSSHFSFDVSSSTFDVNVDVLQIGSYTGLKSIGRILELFVPAHAIPNFDLTVTDFDSVGYNELVCEDAVFAIDDVFVSGAIGGFEFSGMNMSSLGRVFKRTDVDTLEDFVFTSTVPLSNLKRTSVRRRSHKNLLPKEGWYYRDGFNMPPYLAPSTVQNYNNYMPLGYIPSAGKFVSIPYYSSLPQVYTRCEDLRSSSVINGVTTSNTFPCRGITYELPACSKYSTRGDCDPIIGLIHSKIVSRAYGQAYEDIQNESAASAYDASAYYSDIARNLSNASGGPSSIQEFFDFGFGMGVHRSYKDYVTYFSGHDLSEEILDLSGGPNIISHTYGPLLFNGFFDKSGSAATTYSLITSSLSSPKLINSGQGSGILSPLGGPSGTYVASTTNSLYIQKYEFRNPHILSGIEFVQTSGDSESNSFTVYNLNTSDSRTAQDNFSYGNPLIKLKSASFFGLPRLRFSLKNYGTPNFLIPEHEFDITVRYFAGKESGGFIGGAAVGMWIHTDPEGGYVWSYNKNFDWVITPVSDLNLQKVEELSHFNAYPVQTIPNTILTSSIPCIDQVFNTSAITKVNIDNLVSEVFKDFTVKVNTLNPPICIPNYYGVSGKQVHRSNQGYTIEVFMLPDETNNSYVVLDYVGMKDTTLNDYVSEFEPTELLTSYRYFVDVASARASRQASITSGIFETSGGSRINYRHHPDWGPQTKSAGFNQYTSIDIYR
jgi:hypothetical protein